MIEINGSIIPSRAINHAFWLLARLLEIDVSTIRLALKNKCLYRTILIDKGQGKKRRLDIPPDDLKIIQGLLLEKLFSRINMSIFPDWSKLTGFITGKSNRHNTIPHINGKSFIQIDLADAFPSVNEEMVRRSLSVLFDPCVIKRMFNRPSLRWFRNRFFAELNPSTNKTYSYPDDGMDLPIDYEITPINVLWAMREIIIWLTVFDNLLPQGTPTAPFLFNLAIVDCQISTLVQKTLDSFLPDNDSVITVYADNLTISSQKLTLSVDDAYCIISAIESQTSFHINRDKIHCTNIKNKSPIITGLSIGKRENTLVTVSRGFQRRARGLCHSAIRNPDLVNPAKGTVAYLIGIYGSIENLPKQIRLPYENLLAQIAKEQTPA